MKSIVFLLLICILLGIGPFKLGNTSSQKIHSKLNQVTSDPIVINNDENLADLANSGDGTQSNPYVIQDLEISTLNVQTGIYITGTTKYFELRNNFIQSGDQEGIYGVHLENVANGTAKIVENVLESNYIGIRLENAPYTIIGNNYISHVNKFGIEIWDGSYNTIIQDNLIEFALEEGIRIEAPNSFILRNNVTTDFNENFFSSGIGVHRDNVIVQGNYVKGYWDGINLSPVSNANIENNTISGSSGGITGWPSSSLIVSNYLINGRFGGDGIRLQGEFETWQANNNVISNNFISEYPNYGFYSMENSNSNLIENNVFLSNNLEQSFPSQALDDGENNVFHNNYWSDWLQPDENDDKVVDNPYSIDGTVNNFDYEPRVDYNANWWVYEDNNLTDSKSSIDSINNQTSSMGNDNQLVLDLGNSINSSLILLGLAMLVAVPVMKFGKIIFSSNFNKLTIGTLKDIIGYAPPLLVGIINGDQNYSSETQEIVSTHLQKFKFLLNPIRLSIIKMLYTYSSYPAFEMREALQVSWGKFTSHVNSLIKADYISSQEEFYEGSPTRILRIEQLGRSTYQELRNILIELFELD